MVMEFDYRIRPKDIAVALAKIDEMTQIFDVYELEREVKKYTQAIKHLLICAEIPMDDSVYFRTFYRLLERIAESPISKPTPVFDDLDMRIIEREMRKMSSKERGKLMNILRVCFDSYDWE